MKEKISKRLLSSLELLGIQIRLDLASKLTLELFFRKDKEEKLLFLKEELKRTIHHIIRETKGGLLDVIFELNEKSSAPVNSFAELFVNTLGQGFNLISLKDEALINSIRKIENILESSEKNFSSALRHSEMVTKRDELFKLPKLKSLVELLMYLHQLDLIYANIDAVQDNRPIVTFISNGNKTNKIIKDSFNAMHTNGWEYAFKNENDFNAFCDLLTLFFEGSKYEIPSAIIKLKPNTKTKVAKALYEIHRELGEKLSGNIEFFKLVRILSPFKKLLDTDMYKTLRK